MGVLQRYLWRLFLARNLLVSGGMVAILGVLDALSKGGLLPTDAGLPDHLWFMLLRAPLIFEQVFVFAFLLSLLVTYVALIRRNELVPIAGAGLSSARQIVALAPAVLAISAGYAILIDQSAPRAQQVLMTWLGPEAVTRNPTLSRDLWVSDGPRLVRIRTVEDGRLSGLTLFDRNETGQMSAISHAETAEPSDAGWRLRGVSQVRYDNAETQPLRLWRYELDSETLRLLSLEPRYLSVGNLQTLSALQGAGNRNADVYRMWIYSRVALPLTALGFLVATALVMQRFGRDPRAELMLVVMMAAGFLYVIFDSVTGTLPDNGALGAATAAFAPLACLWLGCGVLALRTIRL